MENEGNHMTPIIILAFTARSHIYVVRAFSCI